MPAVLSNASKASSSKTGGGQSPSGRTVLSAASARRLITTTSPPRSLSPFDARLAPEGADSCAPTRMSPVAIASLMKDRVEEGQAKRIAASNRTPLSLFVNILFSINSLFPVHLLVSIHHGGGDRCHAFPVLPAGPGKIGILGGIGNAPRESEKPDTESRLNNFSNHSRSSPKDSDQPSD